MSTSRTLLTPIFTSGKLKGIMSAVHDSTDDFMDFLAKNNNDDLEVKDTMQICTCEILARIGCGVKPDILKDPENNLFYKQVKSSSSCRILPFIWTLWKKGSDHLGHSWRGLGRFLGSQ